MAEFNGLALSQFPDFVIATRDHYVDLDQKVLNETARNNYEILDLISGREEREIIQGGSAVKAFLRLKKHQSAQNYKPNQVLTPKGVNLLSDLKVPWRFTASNFAWAEEPVDLNQDAGVDQLVDNLDEWRSAARQDVIDFMEEQLFQTPDAASMEAADGDTPFSYFSFITDDGQMPAGFTTLQGQADSPNYRNQVEGFTQADLKTIEPAFMSMWLKLRWKTPPSTETWIQSTDWRKIKILTDTAGVKLYVSAMTAVGSRLVPVEDPGKYIANPTYANIPIEGYAILDEKAWAKSKYIWRDGRYMHPVFHKRRFLQEQDPMRAGAAQPFSWVVWNKTYWNLICKSRKRQGIIVGA